MFFNFNLKVIKLNLSQKIIHSLKMSIQKKNGTFVVTVSFSFEVSWYNSVLIW